METRIIECVPNFSEGRNHLIIKEITDSIESVDGIKLLDVDPGKDTNRTVVTFAGEPDKVVEAAFLAVKKASELIDMSKHKGEHPRMGATDVCPLIPVSGISMEETIIYARQLGKRIGDELGIPVYCYENAAFEEKRKNLANCREGEYEGLPEKLKDPQWEPDFGPAHFNSKSGATAVGARDFLVAFNVNLNTTSVRRANAIAYDVREKGRPLREGNSLIGKIIKDSNGKNIMIPGSLKSVKAIGWFIEEYGIAQISMNLTDISVAPVHIAFDEVCRRAEERGIRVTGSELVGLIPLKAMLDAGRYFLKKQQRSVGIPDEEILRIAVRSMGLDELHEFNCNEKIIEYVMADKISSSLKDLSLKDFMDETASESPAPGGGSVSAYMGAMGIALGTMVANLSGHKRGWDDKWEEFSDWADKGKELQNKLLRLVDEDTAAYNKLLGAYGLPKKTDAEKLIRKDAVDNATRTAILVPFSVMETAVKGFDLIQAMVLNGNPNSLSDAGVGALALRACIKGAFMNVRINISGLEDKKFTDQFIEKGIAIEKETERREAEILNLINEKFR